MIYKKARGISLYDNPSRLSAFASALCCCNSIEYLEMWRSTNRPQIFKTKPKRRTKPTLSEGSQKEGIQVILEQSAFSTRS